MASQNWLAQSNEITINRTRIRYSLLSVALPVSVCDAVKAHSCTGDSNWFGRARGPIDPPLWRVCVKRNNFELQIKGWSEGAHNFHITLSGSLWNDVFGSKSNFRFGFRSNGRFFSLGAETSNGALRTPNEKRNAKEKNFHPARPFDRSAIN